MTGLVPSVMPRSGGTLREAYCRNGALYIDRGRAVATAFS